jgi:hypothetical protein
LPVDLFAKPTGPELFQAFRLPLILADTGAEVPFEGGLEIWPGQTKELKPGGYHLMFMGLRQGLREGETMKGTLVFEKAGTVGVEYHVMRIGAQ